MKKKDKYESPFRSFATFWNGVYTFSLKAIGIRAILVTLVRLARKVGGAKQLGLEDTLASYDGLASIHAKAMTGDSLAYAELLALATISAGMLNDATNQRPELAGEFVRGSLTWPILLPYCGTDDDESPQHRLKKLGFGEQARAADMRSFKNNLGMLALLLHAYRALRAVHHGGIDTLLKENPAKAHAVNVWNASVKGVLDRSTPKLSNLPFSEVADIRAYRSGRVSTTGKQVEVSGDVRLKIKEWFVRLQPLYRNWLTLGQTKNKTNKGDQQASV